jgi:hypothetical protein
MEIEKKKKKKKKSSRLSATGKRGEAACDQSHRKAPGL